MGKKMNKSTASHNPMPLVSVVIPVHNTPLVDFRRCVNSVIDQEYENFEIIVVDDESDEFFSHEYEEISKEEQNFTYCYIQKRGVSGARNYGIDKANGDYICFVDSDDTVTNNFIADSIKKALEYNADIVIGKITFNPPMLVNQKIPELKIINDCDKVLEYMFFNNEKNNFQILGSPCGRIFSKELYKNTLFNEKLVNFEDQLYNREIISKANKIVLVPEYYYVYYQNDYSTMNSTHKKWNQMVEWITFWQEWDRLNKDLEEGKLKREFEKSTVYFFYDAVIEGIRAGEKYDRKAMLDLLELPVFKKNCQKLTFSDYEPVKRKLMFLLMKYKMLFMIYELLKIKNKVK